MKISIRWVQEFCPFQSAESPREIGVRFSVATAEVEGAEARGEGLRKILAARVLAVRPHPGADQLRLARIDAGSAGMSEVVCGAPNVAAGMVVPYAPPGSTVGGREIQVARIRGVESPGMLLSEAELGFSDAAGGLLELPAGTPAGTPLSRLFPGAYDTVLEVDNKSLTHRPDLWGHYGIAREFSVIYGTPLKPYAVKEALASQGGESGIRVEILPEADPAPAPRCARYCGLRIDGVKIGPSPERLRLRLNAMGLRPISNVVDVTNYVMLELGQPLHAFDAARIRGGAIRVRRAAAGERLKLLDGSAAELSAEDLVIADGEGALALAGVMGGEGSGVSASTTSVFLEAASFEPAGVRRTAIRTARTDSSTRFEKSLDPELPRPAILRAAEMILELCPGARVVGPLQDVGYRPRAPIVIETSPRAIAERLGADVKISESRAILLGLGFEIQGKKGSVGEELWKVKVPSWRATKDISIPEDLVEEVGRIHGYGKISPYPPLWPVVAAPLNPARLLERKAKLFLSLHGGLAEVFTYSMVGAAHCRAFGLDPEQCLKLRNPMSEELDRMRREIVPVLLEKAGENARFQKQFAFFELGRVYLKEPGKIREKDLPRENSRVAGILAFERKGEERFYEARHLVLSLLAHLGASGVELSPLAADRSWIHPAAGARLSREGAELGRLYRVHPSTAARLELPEEVLAFDLDFDAILALPQRPERYRKLPRFPSVTFDVAVVSPERTPAAEIAATIRAAAGAGLRSVEPFDVYRGANLPEGKKSIAFQIAVGADDHTLSSAEAEGLLQAVVEALGEKGFPIRS